MTQENKKAPRSAPTLTEGQSSNGAPTPENLKNQVTNHQEGNSSLNTKYTNPLQAPKFKTLDSLPKPGWAEVDHPWELGDEFAVREFSTFNQHIPILNEYGKLQGQVNICAREVRIFDYPTEREPEGVNSVLKGIDLHIEDDASELTPQQAKQIGHTLIELAEKVEASHQADRIREKREQHNGPDEALMYVPAWATQSDSWEFDGGSDDMNRHHYFSPGTGMFTLVEGVELDINRELNRNYLVVEFKIDGLQGGDTGSSPSELIGAVDAAIRDLEQIRTTLRAIEQAESKVA